MPRGMHTHNEKYVGQVSGAGRPPISGYGYQELHPPGRISAEKPESLLQVKHVPNRQTRGTPPMRRKRPSTSRSAKGRKTEDLKVHSNGKSNDSGDEITHAITRSTTQSQLQSIVKKEAQNTSRCRSEVPRTILETLSEEETNNLQSEMLIDDGSEWVEVDEYEAFDFLTHEELSKSEVEEYVWL